MSSSLKKGEKVVSPIPGGMTDINSVKVEYDRPQRESKGKNNLILRFFSRFNVSCGEKTAKLIELLIVLAVDFFVLLYDLCIGIWSISLGSVTVRNDTETCNMHLFYTLIFVLGTFFFMQFFMQLLHAILFMYVVCFGRRNEIRFGWENMEVCERVLSVFQIGACVFGLIVYITIIITIFVNLMIPGNKCNKSEYFGTMKLYALSNFIAICVVVTVIVLAATLFLACLFLVCTGEVLEVIRSGRNRDKEYEPLDD